MRPRKALEKGRVAPAPVVVQVDPERWNGMRLTRSPCRTVLTLSMPEHVRAAVRKWLPGYHS